MGWGGEGGGGGAECCEGGGGGGGGAGSRGGGGGGGGYLCNGSDRDLSIISTTMLSGKGLSSLYSRTSRMVFAVNVTPGNTFAPPTWASRAPPLGERERTCYIACLIAC